MLGGTMTDIQKPFDSAAQDYDAHRPWGFSIRTFPVFSKSG
jgi:hypothetical protein